MLTTDANRTADALSFLFNVHAPADVLQTITRNPFGGLDITRDELTLRINPIDGEWAAGAEMFVLTWNQVCHGSLRVSDVPADALADIAGAFAGGCGWCA